MILNLGNFPKNNISYMDFKTSEFPGGEVFFRITDSTYSNGIGVNHWIYTRLNSSKDFMQLAMAVDALRRKGSKYIECTIPYLPYARQDRICNDGEALSLKVFANLLNSLKLDKIRCWDVHSDVSSALIDNLEVIDNSELVKLALSDIKSKAVHILSPDSGACKKVYKLVEKLNFQDLSRTIRKELGYPDTIEIHECGKTRDLATTKITGTKIPDSVIRTRNDEPIVIIDDICDGGATFLGIAEELRKHCSNDLYLIVTHGIFSKGETELAKHFKKVYTTNSIRDDDDSIGVGLRPEKSKLVVRFDIFTGKQL